MKKTTVIFRKLKNGDVIAVFAEIVIRNNSPYACESYMKGGCFGSAAESMTTRTFRLHREFCGLTDDLRVNDITEVISGSVPASPSEFEQVETELESRGYDLRICQRFSTPMLRKAIEAQKRLIGIQTE